MALTRHHEVTRVLEERLPADVVHIIITNLVKLCREYYLDTMCGKNYCISYIKQYMHGTGKYHVSFAPQLSCVWYEGSVYAATGLFQFSFSMENCEKEFSSFWKNDVYSLVLFPRISHGFFIFTNDLCNILNIDSGLFLNGKDECNILDFYIETPPTMINYILDFSVYVQRIAKKEWCTDFCDLIELMKINI